MHRSMHALLQDKSSTKSNKNKGKFPSHTSDDNVLHCQNLEPNNENVREVSTYTELVPVNQPGESAQPSNVTLSEDKKYGMLPKYSVALLLFLEVNVCQESDRRSLESLFKDETKSFLQYFLPMHCLWDDCVVYQYMFTANPVAVVLVEHIE